MFKNADGSETVRYFTDRQLFKDGQGAWRRVDSTLAGDAAGWRVAADSLEKRFGRRANAAEIASVELAEGARVSFGVAGAAPAQGRAAGNKVRYDEVRPGADLTFEASSLGIKETIILKSAQAPTTWDFPLDLDGVTAKLVDEEIQLLDAEGTQVGHIPPGFMTDSNVDPRTGDAPRSDDVNYELIESASGPVLRVSVDQTWLADPSRQFPVFVDPTVSGVGSEGDTYVMKGFTNDYSNEAELKVGTYDGGAHIAASLLKFNIPNQMNNHIFNAKLKMFATHSWSCNARDVVIRPLISSWTIGGNKSWPGPSWGGEDARVRFAAGYTGCGNRWVDFDITSRIDQWAHSTSPNYGLRVGADGADNFAWKKFASANSAHAPYLEISHTPFWADYNAITNFVAPSTNANGSARVTVTNRGAETWTPSTYQLGYRIWNTGTSPETELPDQWVERTNVPTNVAPGQSITMDVGLRKLVPGNFRLQFDMVRPGITRFSDAGVPMSGSVSFSIGAHPPVVQTWSPAAGFQSDTRQPMLVMTAKDPDSYPTTGLTYQFKVTNLDGSLVEQSGWGGSIWGVPANKLEWGKDYLWYGRANDGENIGAWTPGILISPRVAQPAITSHLGGQDGGGLDPGVGNFTAEATDALVTSVGPELVVERTYNSQDPRTDLAFGAGWSTPWDTRLVADADGSGNVVVTFPDGRQGRFGLNTDGTYARPAGSRGTLVSAAGGGWTLRDVGDVRYKFDASGQLSTITDSTGHGQTLTRDPSGRVAKATDAVTGRSLTFEWTAGHVTKVITGSAPALAWTYAYDGDTLSEACDPEQGCTTYSYASSPQFRTAVVDSNPVGYWRLGESAGKAASAVPGIWREIDGTHVATAEGGAGPIAGSGLSAAGFNGTSSVVTLPAGLVQGSHLALEMWFSTTANGALFGGQNWKVGEPAGTESSATLYVGADGKLHGGFPTTTGGTITSAGTVNDGTWHHVALSGAGNTQSLYLDGDLVGTLSNQIDWKSMSENQIGAAWTAGAPSAPSAGMSHFSGKIAEVALHHRPLSAATVTGHADAGAAAKKLAAVTEPSHGAATSALTYSGATERVTTHDDANGGTWQLSAPATTNHGTADLPDWRTTVSVTDPAGDAAKFVYDPTRGGQMMTLTDGSGATTSYEYDAGGFPFKVTDPNGHVTELRHDARGNEISRTQCRTAGTDCYTSYREYFLNAADPLDPRNDQVTVFRDARSAGQADDTFATTYSYFPNGELQSVAVPGAAGAPKRVTTNVYTDGTEPAVGGGTAPAWLLKSVTDPGGAVTSYQYAASGDLAKETDPVGLLTTHEYDGLGRETAETVTSSTVPDGARTTYKYDGASRVIEELEPVVTNAVAGGERQQKTVTTYRPDGSPSTVVVSDTKSTTSRTTTYGYDSRGRETSVTDPEGAVTRVTYDAFGQSATRTDAEGTVWSYTYTPGKRQLATTRVDEFTGGPTPATNLVVESRAYDPAGRAASSTDAMGNTVEYKYFDDGLLKSETLLGYDDPDTGQSRSLLLAEYAYTGNGAVKSMTKGEGRYSTTTSYDPGGRPVTSTDLDGPTTLRSTVTTYDALDNPTEVIERGPAGGDLSRTVVEYDKLGRETLRTDFLNGSDRAITKTVRDQRGLPTQLIDAPGNAAGAVAADYTTTISYDALGQQVTVTAPPVSVEENGAEAVLKRPVTTLGYDAFGAVTHTKDPRGNVTIRSYDKAGRETSTRLPDYLPPGASTPLTATISREYDKLGRVVVDRNADGAETKLVYSEFGDLTKRTDPSPSAGVAGGVTSTAYTPLGWPLDVTGPTGAKTFATYDELGRQLTSTVTERAPTPQVLTTEYRYDALGNPSKMITPTGLTTSFEHDDLGNPTRMVSPAGIATAAAYDGMGRVTRIDDPKRAPVVYDYDLGGRTTAVRDLGPAGGTLRTRSSSYDLAGNPLVSTDGAGGHTTRVYDALGQLRKLTQTISDTATAETTYGYDIAGKVSRVTDGNGHRTIHTSNAWGLPESVIEPATAQTPDAADRTFTNRYDIAGRSAKVIEPGGVTVTRSYDGAGRLVRESGAGAEAATEDRTFAYDAAGRLTQAATGNAVNNYTYNDRGRVTTATGASGSTTYGWDTEGRVNSIETGSGKTQYTYSGTDGRLSGTLDPLTGSSATYGYDPEGRVASVATGPSRHVFAYDNFGRLDKDTLETGGAATASIDYGYDLADRLTAKNVTGIAGAASNTYGYDKAGRLTSWDNGTGAVAYGWDKAGNLTRRGAETATFNERNQLVQQGDTTYAYSPRGSLSARTTGSETDTVEFDAFGQLVTDGARRNSYDALHRLVSADGEQLEYVGSSLKVAYDGMRRYTYGPDGDVLGVGAADPAAQATLGWSDLHTDLVGTVDPETGSLAGSRTFDPFGSVVASSGAQPALGFQHQFTDPETGNVSMGARWYQPETGGFASRDAAILDPTDPSNANRYAYAGGNPLTQTDPEGYFWGKVFSVAKKVVKTTVSVAKEVSGYNDLKGCVGGSLSSCAWFVAGLTPVGKIAKSVKVAAKATTAAVASTKVVTSTAKVTSKVTYVATKTTTKVTSTASKVTSKVSSRVSSATSKASSRVSATTRSVSRATSASVTRLGKSGHAAAEVTRASVRNAGKAAARGGLRGGSSVVRAASKAAASAAAVRVTAHNGVKRAAAKATTRMTPAKAPTTTSVSPSVQTKIGDAVDQPIGGSSLVDEGLGGAADLGAGAADEVGAELAAIMPGFATPSGGGPAAGSGGGGLLSEVPTTGAMTASSKGPSVRYSRAKHYGGAQTSSPVARELREGAEGTACPSCGSMQVSGTNTAPVPEHSPSLLEHYYNNGGFAMTDAQRRSYAQSADAFDGTMCLTCQRSQGGKLSQLSRQLAQRWGL